MRLPFAEQQERDTRKRPPKSFVQKLEPRVFTTWIQSRLSVRKLAAIDADDQSAVEAIDPDTGEITRCPRHPKISYIQPAR
jgi:hypothetical protein